MSASKPKAKKPLPRFSVLDDLKALVQKAFQFIFGVTLNWEQQRDIIKNNYDLGVSHFNAGNVNDAVLRFKLVTWLEPRHTLGWYYLGRSLLTAGKIAPAQAALKKALELKPGHEEATYLLAVAGGARAGAMPTHMPRSLALDHFEGLAADYTKEQIDAFQYVGHRILADTVRNCMTQGRIDHDILELGVGTGLLGPQLRGVAVHMTGVDMSAKMLEEAVKVQDEQGRKVYDVLVNREIHEYLREAPAASHDIVLAANLVSYIGELAPLFQAVVPVLKPGGLFAFTADPLEGDGFRLDPEAGRFRYSQSYLRNLAGSARLSELKMEQGNAYPDYPVWVCVFRK